jgi:hypothetical protein
VLFYQVDDARKHRIASHSRDLCLQRSFFHNAAADDKIFFSFCHRQAFAGKQGFVHLCIAPQNFAVGRHLLTGIDLHQVAHFQLGVFNGKISSWCWSSKAIMLAITFCDFTKA